MTAYRAADRVEVDYLDFGTRGEVRRDKLFRLLPPFLAAAPLALPAALAVRPRAPATSWPSPAIHRLGQILQLERSVVFAARVLAATDGRLLVDLVTSKGERVAEVLVREGLAAPRDGGQVEPLEQVVERLLTPAVVTSLVRKVGSVGVMPESLLPRLEGLVDSPTLI